MESLIYLLKQHKPDLQFLYLSATTGNPEEFAAHFKAELVKTEDHERPVPLKTEIIPHAPGRNRQESFQIWMHHITLLLDRFTSLPHLPQILIFCQARSHTKHLQKLFKLKWPQIPTEIHHAGRTQTDRQQIEAAFRSGDLTVIFCTPTLTMGVNVPADVVVVTSITRYNSLARRQELISANELLQMVGRAGRPGQTSILYDQINGQRHRYGLALIFCENRYILDAQEMIAEPVILRSQIPLNLKYVLCTWICSGIEHVQPLIELYKSIFDPDLDLVAFSEAFTWLLDKIFLARDPEGNLTPHHKAEIVAYYAIQPETIQYWYAMRHRLEGYKNPSEITAPIVLLALLSCPEFLQQVHVEKEADGDLIANAKLVLDTHPLFLLLFPPLQKHMQPQLLECALKAFYMIYHEYIEQRYGLFRKIRLKKVSISHGDVQHLIGGALRLITALKALFGVRWRYGSQIKTLITGLEANPPIFDPDLLSLLQIKHVGLKSALLLQKVGIKNQEDLTMANASKLARLLKHEVAVLNTHLERTGSGKQWRTIGVKSIEKMQGKDIPSDTNLKKNTKKLFDFVGIG